jgi:phosphatidylglycerophosphate synthase
MWALALSGRSAPLAILLALAGISDAMDGFLARRSGLADAHGSRLDSVADNLILPSALIWLILLRRAALADNLILTFACATTYLGSLAVGWVKFRRLGDLHLYSSKVAGVLLYLLVVDVLLTTDYSRLLLYVAGAAFLASSVETLVVQVTASGPEPGLGTIFVRRHRQESERHRLHPYHQDGDQQPLQRTDCQPDQKSDYNPQLQEAGATTDVE